MASQNEENDAAYARGVERGQSEGFLGSLADLVGGVIVDAIPKPARTAELIQIERKGYEHGRSHPTADPSDDVEGEDSSTGSDVEAGGSGAAPILFLALICGGAAAVFGAFDRARDGTEVTKVATPDASPIRSSSPSEYLRDFSDERAEVKNLFQYVGQPDVGGGTAPQRPLRFDPNARRATSRDNRTVFLRDFEAELAEIRSLSQSREKTP